MTLIMHGADAGGRASGDGGRQAGPAVKRTRQLHAAGAVVRERAVSSSSSFPEGLDGLGAGHLSRSLNHIKKEMSSAIDRHFFF